MPGAPAAPRRTLRARPATCRGRYRVSAGQATRRAAPDAGRPIFRRRRVARTVLRQNFWGARPDAASDAAKNHVPRGAATACQPGGAPSSRKKLIFRHVSHIKLKSGTPPRGNAPTYPRPVRRALRAWIGASARRPTEKLEAEGRYGPPGGRPPWAGAPRRGLERAAGGPRIPRLIKQTARKRTGGQPFSRSVS